jgi:hypothetical protein
VDAGAVQLDWRGLLGPDTQWRSTMPRSITIKTHLRNFSSYIEVSSYMYEVWPSLCTRCKGVRGHFGNLRGGAGGASLSLGIVFRVQGGSSRRGPLYRHGQHHIIVACTCAMMSFYNSDYVIMWAALRIYMDWEIF